MERGTLRFISIVCPYWRSRVAIDLYLLCAPNGKEEWLKIFMCVPLMERWSGSQINIYCVPLMEKRSGS